MPKGGKKKYPLKVRSLQEKPLLDAIYRVTYRHRIKDTKVEMVRELMARMSRAGLAGSMKWEKDWGTVEADLIAMRQMSLAYMVEVFDLGKIGEKGEEIDMVKKETIKRIIERIRGTLHPSMITGDLDRMSHGTLGLIAKALGVENVDNNARDVFENQNNLETVQPAGVQEPLQTTGGNGVARAEVLSELSNE